MPTMPTTLAALAVGAAPDAPLDAVEVHAVVGATGHGATMGSREDLEAPLRFCVRTGVRPVVDSTYPLARTRDALARLASGAHFGKVVITVP